MIDCRCTHSIEVVVEIEKLMTLRMDTVVMVSVVNSLSNIFA